MAEPVTEPGWYRAGTSDRIRIRHAQAMAGVLIARRAGEAEGGS